MELWQNQKTEGVRMSVEQVRLEARRFQRKISARNLREYVAALAVFAFFGYEFLRVRGLPLLRVGFGLILAGTAYLVWHLLSKGSPAEADESAGLSGWIEFRRRELVRQRDLLQGIWRWYLGPVIPGILVVVIAFGRVVWRRVAHPAFLVGTDVLLMAAVFFVLDRVNAKGARKLQWQIDELDEQDRD
jgi:hypothetical protein